jgi:hypothetical protein
VAAELTREVQFTPAYDKRDPNPTKSYGIHGVNITFYLKGPKGVAQFLIYTNWQLPSVSREARGSCKPQDEYSWCPNEPMAADLGYHAPVPQYEDQSMMDHCDLLPDGCYYDGSGLNAKRVFDLLVTNGGEAVWTALQEVYDDIKDVGWPTVD